MYCHHLVLPSPSLCAALLTFYCYPKLSAQTATPLWRKHGPLTLLDPRARRDQKGRACRKTQDQPITKEVAQEEPCPRRTRINETGAAVPGSQESITRGVQNLQLADVLAAQPDHAERPSPMMPNSRRRAQQQPRHQRAFLQCAQCGADPRAYTSSSDSGLMGHMSQVHRGQPLVQVSTAQRL